jgi:hypothetical protein
MSPEARAQGIMEKIIGVSGEGAFDDLEHPVFMGFSWLVNDDPMQLCPEASNLLQRYATVVLYFSTLGDSWSMCSRVGSTPCESNSFLSAAHECNWGGITCDSVDRITRINRGESN